MWALVQDLLGQLRRLRGALLTLAVLFLIVMLIEVDLGHRAALLNHDSWLALIPVVWLPISLVALMAVQVVPSKATSYIAIAVMAVSAAVGMVGSDLHMMAAGVDFSHVGVVGTAIHLAIHAPSLTGLVTAPHVWLGEPPPLVPLSFAVACCLGLIPLMVKGQRRFAAPPVAIGRILYGLVALCGITGVVFGARVYGGTSPCSR
jgi:hypothetical protein